MRRFGVVVGLLLLAAAGMSIPLAASPASANGAVPERGYAVVQGPGLAHPIVISSPWKQARGGYYGNQAEVFLNVATFAGAIPGAVRPSPNAPPSSSLGPSYQVTYFRDCCPSAVRQVLYPFAEGGPWVFTRPGQRSALHMVFGRFWGGGASEGWARAAPSLALYLVARGLPKALPTVASSPAKALPTTAPSTAPRPRTEGTGPGLWVGGLAALAVLLTTVLILSRRRHYPRRHGLTKAT